MRNAFARVRDTDLFYQELGSGPPLVLLHGLDDTHRTWRRVAPLLAAKRRVIAPDLPGCGLSGRPDASYSLRWQAQVMGAFLDELDLRDVDLVGHSYGGGVAQFMLLEHRHRIRRMALVASGGLGREVAFELRLAALPFVVEDLGQPFMAAATPFVLTAVGAAVGPEEVAWIRRVNAKPGTARAFGRTVRDVIDWRGQRRSFLDHVREVEVLPPMALFWGERDRIVPVAHGAATTRCLEGVKLTVFPGCGHFVHQERPDELACALLEFFESPSADPVRFLGTAPTRPGVAKRILATLGNVLGAGGGAREAARAE